MIKNGGRKGVDPSRYRRTKDLRDVYDTDEEMKTGVYNKDSSPHILSSNMNKYGNQFFYRGDIKLEKKIGTNRYRCRHLIKNETFIPKNEKNPTEYCKG
jgi:hypothetical protein